MTMNTTYNGQYPPWRRRLEAKIKAAKMEVGQLSELQKGVMKKELPNKQQTAHAWGTANKPKE